MFLNSHFLLSNMDHSESGCCWQTENQAAISRYHHTHVVLFFRGPFTLYRILFTTTSRIQILFINKYQNSRCDQTFDQGRLQLNRLHQTTNAAKAKFGNTDAKVSMQLERHPAEG